VEGSSRLEPWRADGPATRSTEMSPHRPQQPVEVSHTPWLPRTASRWSVRVRQRGANEPLLVSQLGNLVV